MLLLVQPDITGLASAVCSVPIHYNNPLQQCRVFVVTLHLASTWSCLKHFKWLGDVIYLFVYLFKLIRTSQTYSINTVRWDALLHLIIMRGNRWKFVNAAVILITINTTKNIKQPKQYLPLIVVLVGSYWCMSQPSGAGTSLHPHQPCWLELIEIESQQLTVAVCLSPEGKSPEEKVETTAS